MTAAMNRRTLLSLGAAALAGGAMVPASGWPAAAAAPIRDFRPGGSGGFDHSAFDALLKAHVEPDGTGYNRVDYKGVKADGAALKAYVASLEAATPSAFSVDEAHAFWINLYNAKTLDVIIDRYPVKSIKDIDLGGGGLFGGGPWSAKLMNVEGRELSLDDVEHRIVRVIFNDPDSHYGLNCASYSCPNLMPRAYTATNLKSQMMESGRQYVNHPRGVRVEGGRVQASKIYSWYADDWGGRDAVRAHWLDLAEPALATELEGAESVRYNYDWSLNDV